MRARAIVLGVILPAAVLLTSCTKREDLTLAEFADRKITVGEFENAYTKVSPEFLPEASGLEGRREFLTTMLNKEVMAHKADELGYDKDPAVAQAMDSFTKMGLQTGYLKKNVADKVKVTEEDLREHYNNMGGTLSIKQILVDTPAQADEVISLLESGADFESVCKRYSKSPDASEGGEVLTVVYGKYHPEIQQVLFKLDVGEYTHPIYTAYGFFICKVLRRTEGKVKEPFEKIRPQLEKEVRAIKEVLATNRFTEKLRESYGVEWYWDNLRICFEALPPDRDFEKAPSRKDEVYPLLYFDPEDLDKPVATYGGKDILVKDFSDYYDQSSFYARPRRAYRVAGVRGFITERIMTDLVQREMTRSKIAEDPEVSAVIKAKREELMINRMWDDMINSQTNVTDKMIRDYYEEHRDNFRMPERRRFGVVLTGDIESAQKAYDELKSGTLFRTVAMAYSIDETTRETLGETEMLTKGEQPEIDAVGFALDGVGAISEPFQTSRGWMILKVTELEEAGEYSLQQARASIESAIREELNDDRLQELLAKWKEELNVTIHEDNLEKIQVEERTGEAPSSRA